jgi:hypothetical protein
MTPAELLAELERQGVTLTLSQRSDRLKVDAPAGVFTAGLRAQLGKHKGGLLRLVSEREFACYQADVRARAVEYQRTRGGTLKAAETEILFQLGGFDKWRSHADELRAA